MKLGRNSKIFINYFLGPVLFIWLSWSLYHQIKSQPGLEEAWKEIRTSLRSPLAWSLVVVFLLMFLNWSIEALKWKMSIRSIQQISFWKALKAVCSGLSFSVTTPNRVGEYLGRLLYMNEGNRLKTISITIVGSISQLIITLAAGLIGLLLMRDKIEAANLVSKLWMQAIIYGTLIVTVLTILFYFRLTWIVRLAEKIPGSKRYIYLVEAVESFSTSMLFKLLFLSACRFLIFFCQYNILFALFKVDISVADAFWAVNVSFLIMAIIPTIAIAELAQRSTVVTAIVGLYAANTLGMTFATASIWFINLIIPAVIGSLLILRIRKMI
jgi:hypothetical protein